LQHRPLGVVGAIVPWNFPLLLMAFKLPPALLTGNTVVLKPAATTPLATLLFGEIVQTIFPAGVVNVIADENDLGAAMSCHPGIDKISFTGSTGTGRRVMANAAPTLKRLTLELGGNDPAIVLDDADPKQVAPKLFDAAFANSGQVCVAIKRLYVHDAIYDEICDELAALAKRAIIGNGLAQGTQFGPLQNKAQFDLVCELIEDARVHGAVIAGGEVAEGPGYFIHPTIVRDISDGTRLVDEEQFGPVLPVIRYSDTQAMIARANSSPFGLGASVWSSDPDRAYAVANEINAGTVWVNKHMDLAPTIPFGGVKQSGLGLELGDDGLKEFTQLRVINVAATGST
jgi:acyl-CoA reductase-like NAD-dependent aldehyde dehydrogenase